MKPVSAGFIYYSILSLQIIIFNEIILPSRFVSRCIFRFHHDRLQLKNLPDAPQPPHTATEPRSLIRAAHLTRKPNHLVTPDTSLLYSCDENPCACIAIEMVTHNQTVVNHPDLPNMRASQ